MWRSSTPRTTWRRSTSTAFERTISVRLLADDALATGDWVLVHVGFAMAKIDQHEADLTLDAVKKMGQSYYDELSAFDSTAIL